MRPSLETLGLLLEASRGAKCPPELLTGPQGLPFGSLWVPWGTTLGSLWWSLGPLGHYFGDVGIMLGPSDCRKGPKSDEERCWDVVFVISSIHSVSLDENRTIKGVLTKGVHLMQL